MVEMGQLHTKLRYWYACFKEMLMVKWCHIVMFVKKSAYGKIVLWKSGTSKKIYNLFLQFRGQLIL